MVMGLNNHYEQLKDIMVSYCKMNGLLANRRTANMLLKGFNTNCVNKLIFETSTFKEVFDINDLKNKIFEYFDTKSIICFYTTSKKISGIDTRVLKEALKRLRRGE